eukprot:3812844-Prorocentrum_lima.AAC.1
MAPDAWHLSRMRSAPLGQLLAGEIALYQREHERHVLVENPRGSELLTLHLWEHVQRHPPVVWTYYDMCAAGLHDIKTK